MVSIDIYFDDLTSKKQQEIKELLNIENSWDMNWDMIPMASVVVESEV